MGQESNLGPLLMIFLGPIVLLFLIAALIRFMDAMPEEKFIWNPPVPLYIKLICWPFIAIYMVLIVLPIIYFQKWTGIEIIPPRESNDVEKMFEHIKIKVKIE